MKPTLEQPASFPGILDDAYARLTEVESMPDSPDERERGRKRRSSKRSRSRHRRSTTDFRKLFDRPKSRANSVGEVGSVDYAYDTYDDRDTHATHDDDIDESLLSPEERSHREIRRRAEVKAEIYLEAGKAALIALLLFLIFPPVGVFVSIWWAIVHGRKLFKVMFEPGIRERLVEDEVSRHVQSRVGDQRRELADEHSRDLEVLSASIAHEIRNPITAAKSLLQQMREDPEALDNPEYAQVALSELERVERSISHLLRFGRDEEMSASRIRMSDVLDSALETFRERAEREGIELRRDFDCEGTLVGDGEKLRRVAINLVGNAMDALVDQATPSPCIDISLGENLAGNVVWVRVRDNGVGIDDETRERIFTPFFTAKQGGTGLGLAITKKLVEAHGGTIEVAKTSEGGAEFILRFPKEGGGERPGVSGGGAGA